jgi:hypothetical protein
MTWRALSARPSAAAGPDAAARAGELRDRRASAAARLAVLDDRVASGRGAHSSTSDLTQS